MLLMSTNPDRDIVDAKCAIPDNANIGPEWLDLCENGKLPKWNGFGAGAGEPQRVTLETLGIGPA